MKGAIEFATLGEWERSVRRTPSSPSRLSLRVADYRLVVDDSYILSFEAQPFYQGRRFHWMICSVQNPDELVSWGYAPTRALAEMAAEREIGRLQSDLSTSGR